MSFLLAASRRKRETIAAGTMDVDGRATGNGGPFRLCGRSSVSPGGVERAGLADGGSGRFADSSGDGVGQLVVDERRCGFQRSAASRFLAAKECALRLLESFPPTDSVSLVTMARPAEQVIAHASLDRRLVRERLAAMSATQRSPDTAGALTAALEILRSSDVPASNRALYVISDFPRTVWEPSTTDPLEDQGSLKAPGRTGFWWVETPAGCRRRLGFFSAVLEWTGQPARSSVWPEGCRMSFESPVRE